LVDLSKIGGGRKKIAPLEPRKILDRLPKPEGFNDLWESQSDVLRIWHERHRGDRDVVIKLNTGGGKTLVGLLIAQSLMTEHGEGALYLCANNQLVDQTLAKAEEFQFPVVRYESGPLNPLFRNGEAILIGTYRSLFHGHSKFHPKGRGVPVRTSTIICDDAHTAFSDVRNAFSITVTRAKNEELYKAITSRFREIAESVNRLGSYDQRIGGHDLGVFEIPFWGWRDHVQGVRDLLAKNADNPEFEYQLPLVMDSLDAAHVLVRSTDVMITPFLPPVDLLPTFSESPHRVFMSATIADDSALIRTFDANPEAVEKPIAPASLAGVGERMILAPALTSIGPKDELEVTRKLCKRVVERNVGVVILVPSEGRAARWKNVATLAISDDVAIAVDSLNDPARDDNGPYVFPNRYDGVDLAKDACRLLVLDGLPQGASGYDEYRANVLRGSSQIELSLAQRVEQGMGRGTRGAGDFCVVVLLGSLVDWVSHRSNVGLMTAATRAQLAIGLEVSKLVEGVDDIEATVNLCLDRTPSWVGLHAREFAERAEEGSNEAALFSAAIKDAKLERAYFSKYASSDYIGAAEVAQKGAALHSDDRLFRGWLLQMAARATFFAYKGQMGLAKELQAEAAKANSSLLAPPGYHISEPLSRVGDQAERVARLVEGYEHRTGYLAAIQRSLLSLTGTVTPAQFEEGIRSLGEHLGFSSERLDRGTGRGPDIAWRTEGRDIFVISCKNEKKSESVTYKKDLAQLLIDAKWIEENYPELTRILVLVQAPSHAAEGLPTAGIHVLTLSRLNDLHAAVINMADTLARSELSLTELQRLTAKLLEKHSLTPTQLTKKYFQPLTAKPTP
jgi:hypothetical protein